MVRTAIQLYTLRGFEEPLPSLLGRVGTTDFDGVEFAGFGETSAAEARGVLTETGLVPVAAHVGIDTLEDDPSAVTSFYDALGCDRLIVPYLSPARFESPEAVRKTIDRLQSLALLLGERGIEFGYHNHDHEFAVPDGDEGDECGNVDEGDGERSAFDLLVAETGDSLSIELDVGWAVAAGRDPVALLERLEGRVPLVHLKDVDASDGRPVELGEGDVDLEACAVAAREAGAEWLIYEHDEPADPAASLEHGAETLESLCERA